MAKPNFMSLVFATLFVSSLALFTICNASHESEVEDERSFTYVEGKGTGPKKWGHIDPHWKVCETGKLQSPIDLLNKRVHVLHSLGQLKRNYKPAPAIIRNRGHDISVEWKGDVGGLKINCSNYKLLQCHWHSPSEHTVNGRRYNMELHMVHQNALGDIMVIGILYTYGRPDPFLAKMLNKMKDVNESGIGDFGIINPWEIKFGSRKYYRYIGSLTTPPCTEGVLWTILKKVRTVSREQVRALRDAVHDGFEANARPTQQRHGRPLYFFNPKDQ